MRISRITPISLEYNDWNGFIFEIFSFDIGNFQRDLFSITAGNNGLSIHVLFIIFEIK